MNLDRNSLDLTTAELIRRGASARIPKQFVFGQHQEGRRLLRSVAIEDASPLKIAKWRTELELAPKLADDNHLFVVHLGGAAVHRQDRTEPVHLPGSFKFLPGPEPSRWSSAGAAVFAHLYLGAEMVGGIAEALHGRDLNDEDLFSSQAIASGPLQRMMATAVESILGDEPISQLQLDAWALILGEAVLRHFSRYADRPQPSKQPTGLSPVAQRRVFEYVDAHLETAVGLSDLADVACMSPYHFARCFKNSTGMTPHHYVLQQRVHRAKDMLRESEQSVAQVAFACGFSSQSHLTTVFKRITGQTPARFRKEALR